MSRKKAGKEELAKEPIHKLLGRMTGRAKMMGDKRAVEIGSVLSEKLTDIINLLHSHNIYGNTNQ